MEYSSFPLQEDSNQFGGITSYCSPSWASEIYLHFHLRQEYCSTFLPHFALASFDHVYFGESTKSSSWVRIKTGAQSSTVHLLTWASLVKRTEESTFVFQSFFSSMRSPLLFLPTGSNITAFVWAPFLSWIPFFSRLNMGWYVKFNPFLTLLVTPEKMIYLFSFHVVLLSRYVLGQ